MPKIISKCCELVKLCHINRSGPVLLHTITVIGRHILYCRIRPLGLLRA